MMQFKLKTFTPFPKAKLDNAVGAAMFAAHEQILTDLNYFVKVDQGQLRDTSYIEQTYTTLSAVWPVIYAKRQYYTGTPSTAVNPNASMMWAEKGAKKFGKDWQKILEKGIKNNL